MAILYNFFLILLLTVPVFSQEFHSVKFGGINEYDDPILIDDYDSIKAVNVLTDEGDLRSIYGNKLYQTIAASSITYLGEFVDSSGNHILISKSGLNIYATDSAGSTSIIKTFTGEREVDAVSAFNKMYFADGTTEPFYYDGTSTAAATGMEDCSFVEYYYNRLVCVNMSTDTSKVYLTWYNQSSLWTVTSDKNSAAIKYFNKDDGWQINCVKNTPFGLFIGKARSTHFLKGYDNNTFYQTDISNTVGCSDDRSVQMVDNDLVWLSQEGIYAYDGTDLRLISREVTPTVKEIRASNSNEYNWTVNTQAEWEAGTTSDSWDTDNNPGVLQLQLSDVTTSYLSTMDFIGEGGENTPVGWSNGTQYVSDSHWGNYSILFGCSVINYFGVYRASDNLLISSMTIGNGYGGTAWTECNLNISTNVVVYIKLVGDYGAYISASPTYNGLKGGYLAIKDAGSAVFIDHPEAVAGSTLTSSNYDSGFTSPDYYSLTSSGTDITVGFYTSSDNITFTGPYSFPVEDAGKKRYWHYKVLTSSSAPLSPFNYLNLVIKSTQPYYSEVNSIGDIASWKAITFSEDFSDSGLVDYHVRSATYAFAADDATPAWTSQTNNDTVAVSTNPYLQYKITPDGSVASTSTVKVNASVVSWIVGTPAPRVASVVDDHRYLLSVSTNSSSLNHLVLIWQKNKKWTFMEDVGYSAMSLFNNIPVAGDGTTGSKIWQIMQDDTYTFDGTAIESTWITKDFAFTLNNHKVFNRLWITADDCDVQDFNVSYMKDRSGVWTSTATTLNSGSFTIKEVEGLFDDYDSARIGRFKFNNDEAGNWFKLKLYSLYYVISPLIK